MLNDNIDLLRLFLGCNCFQLAVRGYIDIIALQIPLSYVVFYVSVTVIVYLQDRGSVPVDWYLTKMPGQPVVLI